MHGICVNNKVDGTQKREIFGLVRQSERELMT